MQNDFKEIKFLYPESSVDDQFFRMSPLIPFSDEITDYLDELSVALKKHPEIRQYPDVATFAFFCRKGNIQGLKRKYSGNGELMLGRGVVFHIAPSNVPVNFAYSLVCGILSGNINIVRVPSGNFRQVEIISDAMQKISNQGKFGLISSRIALIRYDRQSSATELLSDICDVRIIWGGDDTIAGIRKSPIPPRSYDITFADRYSICAINADLYISSEEKDSIAAGFYNDTYLFDQNACTSPHLIIWTGSEENVRKSQDIFWLKLHELAANRYFVEPVVVVDKLTSVYRSAADLEGIRKIEMPDNLLWRIRLKNLVADLDKFRCTSGYFLEYHATKLTEITKIIDRKYQTLSYFGFSKSELSDLISHNKPSGIDRIVPIGKTTDFSLTWDGFNLIQALSRSIDIV